MAQLQLQPATTGKKNRGYKAALKVDMTPMVDLGFLLITFFIFTTNLSSYKGTDLFMPADGPQTKYPESRTLNVLLAKNNKVYVYDGTWEQAVQRNGVIETSYHVYTGIGSIIREKQKRLAQASGEKAKEELMLIVKAADESSYQNLINTIDEVLINKVKRYAVVDASEEEKAFIAHR